MPLILSRKVNYHCHSQYCDGKAPLEDYVQIALKRGFSQLGFSSHAPLPFDCDWVMPQEKLEDYYQEIQSLKQKYQGKIEILAGLEIDYIDGLSGPSSPLFQKHNWDFCIGSLHFLPSKNRKSGFREIDYSAKDLQNFIQEDFDGSIHKMLECYYNLLKKLINLHHFDILGHIDLPIKFNRKLKLFDEKSPWYQELALSALEILAAKKVFLEINTGAMARGHQDKPYPAKFILHKAKKLNIPIVLSSDCHNPPDIDFAYKEACELIFKCGYECG